MTTATLYIVATPIGNLDDISQRALNILREVDLIAAEDTRHSQLLLNRYGIKKTMYAYHQHNERQQAEQLLHKLESGQKIALISDAGTPLISDPGFFLVKLVSEAGIKVVPIPGPSAVLTALCASGLPCDRFYFAGFLPAKAAAREKQLATLQTMTCTLIFYAAPHRIIAVLSSMMTIFGEQRPAVVARELTQKFETFYYGTLESIKQQLEQQAEQQKGEFVILLQGAEPLENQANDVQLEHTLKTLLAELPLKQAVKLAANLTGLSKNKVYKTALIIKNK